MARYQKGSVGSTAWREDSRACGKVRSPRGPDPGDRAKARIDLANAVAQQQPRQWWGQHLSQLPDRLLQCLQISPS
nr:hypothetical protein CFP56_22561 [Quercus suber]